MKLYKTRNEAEKAARKKNEKSRKARYSVETRYKVTAKKHSKLIKFLTQ